MNTLNALCDMEVNLKNAAIEDHRRDKQDLDEKRREALRVRTMYRDFSRRAEAEVERRVAEGLRNAGVRPAPAEPARPTADADRAEIDRLRRRVEELARPAPVEPVRPTADADRAEIDRLRRRVEELGERLRNCRCQGTTTIPEVVLDDNRSDEPPDDFGTQPQDQEQITTLPQSTYEQPQPATQPPQPPASNTNGQQIGDRLGNPEMGSQDQGQIYLPQSIYREPQPPRPQQIRPQPSQTTLQPPQSQPPQPPLQPQLPPPPQQQLPPQISLQPNAQALNNQQTEQRPDNFGAPTQVPEQTALDNTQQQGPIIQGSLESVQQPDPMRVDDGGDVVPQQALNRADQPMDLVMGEAEIVDAVMGEAETVNDSTQEGEIVDVSMGEAQTMDDVMDEGGASGQPPQELPSNTPFPTAQPSQPEQGTGTEPAHEDDDGELPDREDVLPQDEPAQPENRTTDQQDVPSTTQDLGPGGDDRSSNPPPRAPIDCTICGWPISDPGDASQHETSCFLYQAPSDLPSTLERPGSAPVEEEEEEEEELQFEDVNCPQCLGTLTNHQPACPPASE